jgi:hypothetical protein
MSIPRPPGTQGPFNLPAKPVEAVIPGAASGFCIFGMLYEPFYMVFWILPA